MQPEGLEKSGSMTRGRLMAVTVLPIAVILLVILGAYLVTSTERAISTSEREMMQLTRTLADRFDGELRRVAQVAEQTAKTVTTVDGLSEQEIYELLENGVRQDPLIYGAAMGFVAGGFDGLPAFCPYVYRDRIDGDDLNRLDIANAYDYLNDPEIRWWHDPANTGRPVWSEPYFDEGAGNIMMSTYSVPFYQAGRLRGITTVDIPLEPLQAFIGTEMNMAVLSSEGRFVHRTGGIPDGNPSILEFWADRPDMVAVARRALAGESGMDQMLDRAGKSQLVFFAPVSDAGWSFIVYLPEDAVIAGAWHEAEWLAGTVLAALALIALTMWLVSGLVLRSQQRASAGERRFRRLMESAPDAMIIVNPKGRMVMVNDQAEKIFGYPAEQMKGESVDMLVPERFRDGHSDKVSGFFSDPARREMGSGMELSGRRADGSEFPIEVGLSPLETSDGMLVSSIVRDITERKRAEAALAESEERSRLVLESTSDGIFGVDAEGRVMFINRAAAALVGFDKDELLGQGIHGLIHHSRGDGKPYPVEECPMHAAFTDGVASTVDDEVLWRKDGSSFDVEYSSTPLRKEGRLVGAVVVFRDITERKIAEAELHHARDAAEAANRAKSAFLANMSHELRTPMNAIIGYSEMLIEEAEDLELQSFISDLQKIHGAGAHLLALINDILDLSKIEAGKMDLYLERFSVDEMLKDIASTVATLVAKNGNRFEIRAEDAGSMVGDLTKVRQTLFNLISNAAKFTEQGKITLTVSRQEGENGEDWLDFQVADTGIGIAPEKIDNLFEEFTQADESTTRKYGGTGLGLAITRRFCELMGGSISARSEPGEGSVFTVRLPARVAEPAQEEAETPAPVAAEPGPAGPTAAVSRPAASSARRGKVLVIDDDPTIRDLLARNLGRDGYDVLLAEDGSRGLELARSNDLVAITLDVMMSGMDGWSVLRSLKADEATRNIPVVMVTIVDDKNLGYTLGAAEYLTKPVDRKRLLDVMHRLQAGGEVLVVDDEPDVRELTRRMLEAEGLKVREAANGKEALEEIRRSPPGLIILDLMMPVMDGFEFLNHLRQDPDLSELPVVVVTAKDLTEDDRARLDGLVTQVLQKGGFRREDLLARVRRSVARASAASGQETEKS